MSSTTPLIQTPELALFANRLRDVLERTGIDISPGSEAIGQLCEGFDSLDDLFLSLKARLKLAELRSEAAYDYLYRMGCIKDVVLEILEP